LDVGNREEGIGNREEGTGNGLTAAERRRLVFGNRVIWLVALANFFVYVVRFGFLDWGPTFLKQMKGIPVAKGGLMIIAFELAAVVGTICAGWVTDKVFKGRGCRTGVFFMLFAALFAFGFWSLPGGAPVWQATLLLMGAGFCIYGPQALTGIIVANQATKEAAALATGFAGIMGYLSTTVSGIGIAFIKERFGWGVALCSIAAFAIVGMVLFLCAWSAKADGYGANAR
jgi:OPA family glycerol-3-phosphate transporter-like MFS transporter/OPA family sugar phosphate sensor protein UhpC-like MFS transporter